ncbi:tail fiber domain-containing protein [Pantoea stewartii]|uniref:tail fiber domain-containing protein n=1 Tax=Pantoea stewartii TaxID=66269 RepID=UPI0019805D7F|nr:tail fiber domain-containing protein [Pantoea stewartii]
MPAGTIALSNNSDAVTGSGTSFTSELKSGDFLVSTVGGVAYTLGVKSIESDTALTLVEQFTGPSTTGLSWTPIPYGTMTAITAQLAAQVTYAVRGFNLDKANWQGIFSNAQSVTVNLPDLSTFTGPGWGYLAGKYADKLDKSQNLADLQNLDTARANFGFINGALPISLGGTGAKSRDDAWSGLARFGNTPGTAAEGSDTRLNSVDQKLGGAIVSDVQVRVLNSFQSGGTTVNQSGRMQLQMPNGNQPDVAEFMTERIVGGAASLVIHHKTDFSDNYWKYNTNGAVNSPGPWNVTSDERHKTNIKAVTNPLSAVMSWRGCTFDKKDYGHDIGLIAQDVEKWCPTAVTSGGRRDFMDGTSIDDLKVLNITGVAAAYHTEAIKALFSLVELVIADPDKALKYIDQIKSSVIPPDYSS